MNANFSLSAPIALPSGRSAIPNADVESGCEAGFDSDQAERTRVRLVSLIPLKPGIYIHVPFCKSRCSYCDFATDVYRSADAVERYVGALVREIADFRIPDSGIPDFEIPDSRISDSRISDVVRAGSNSEITNPKSQIATVYFGGGTPSLLTANELEKIFQAIRMRFVVCENAEITLEMNPATVTLEKLLDFRSLGVNRASFGVQTFDDKALKLLARGHDANDARETFRLLRKAGFGNISFDLIAGLPDQSLGGWKKNLKEALELSPEHLSLYLLEIHQGTPLAEQLRSNRRPMPDEDLAGEMYETMIEMTSAAGFNQYEISNFARAGFESRHNSKYWLLEPVFGFGVSAHSFDGRFRFSNERDTNRYVSLVEGGAAAEVYREESDLASEFAFLGLRMMRGIDLDDYKQRFGDDLLEVRGREIERLTSLDLLERAGNRLRLTVKGALFSNEVFQEFV